MNLHAEILHWSSFIGEHNRRRVIRKLAFGFGVAVSKRIISVTFSSLNTQTLQFSKDLLWIYNWLSLHSQHLLQIVLMEILTCAQALSSPTSSPAGHQSSSGGGLRWAQCGALCRWCQALQWRSGQFCWAHKCMGCRRCWDRDTVCKWNHYILSYTK